MLDLSNGPVHISVEAGIGGTSLCLSLTAAVLESNSRVVWLGRHPLDSKRTREIFTGLNEVQLERLFVVEFGEDLLTRTTALKPLIKRLDDSDLVVIDDWCSAFGRAAAADLQAVRTLIEVAENTRIILTAKAYEAPVGGEDVWRSRGEQLSGVRQIWLLREEGIRNCRALIDGDSRTRLVLRESGFFPS
ncbi:MAG: hypothetical protein VX191_00300 [Candidatus Thermoplasmatota archaeon]|nr:hypothetical protein [Candidatus Thermoplasmatota archaeon]